MIKNLTILNTIGIQYLGTSYTSDPVQLVQIYINGDSKKSF